MNTYVQAAFTGFAVGKLSVSLIVMLEDGLMFYATAQVDFSADSTAINAAIKQAAADAVKAQHGVTLDPATEILLIGGGA